MTAGFIACLIVVPLLLLIGGAVVGLGCYAHKRSKTDPHDDWGFGRWFAWAIGGLILLGTTIGFGFGLYPYDMAYHSYRTVQGTVTSNREVVLGSDWVVTFAGSRTQYDCEETRCSDAQPGSHLAIRCVKNFQFSATASYDCKFRNLVIP